MPKAPLAAPAIRERGGTRGAYGSGPAQEQPLA